MESSDQQFKPPAILDGTFFKIISREADGTVRAKCLKCPESKGDGTIISGKLHPTSNFNTHVKRKHPESTKDYDAHVKSADVKNKLQRQSILNFERTVLVSGVKKHTEQLIINFVVQTMQPLSIVSEESFKKLITGLNQNTTVMSRGTLSSRIKNEFESMKDVLKRKLVCVPFVCLTADIWSVKSRSFMGVTCHWLTTDIKSHFVRSSTVLALQRFEGRHTHDRIADMLQTLIDEFGLSNKVVSIVTDNGSNFVKAFTEFGALEDSDPLTLKLKESGFTDAVQEDDLDAVREDIPNLEEYTTNLPPHIRCASHTLNLIAKKEPEMVDSDPRQSRLNKRIMRSTMAKCSGLWSKAARSVILNESIKNLTGKCLVLPVPTRWNSTYDAVSRLVLDVSYLGEVFDLAGVVRLTPMETDFLSEYKIAMEPLAWAIDTLQGEVNCFYGHLAPTLLSAQVKLNKIMEDSNGHGFSRCIANSLKSSLNERYGHVLSFDLKLAKREILSAVTIPLLILRWIPSDYRDAVKALFLEEAGKFCSFVYVEETQKENATQGSPWDIILEEAISSSSGKTINNVDCFQYFDDSDISLSCLLKYPTVKNMFIHYNTSLPSSAPAERLFSYGGMILRPKRSCLRDELFEALCFLKLYKDF